MVVFGLSCLAVLSHSSLHLISSYILKFPCATHVALYLRIYAFGFDPNVYAFLTIPLFQQRGFGVIIIVFLMRMQDSWGN